MPVLLYYYLSNNVDYVYTAVLQLLLKYKIWMLPPLLSREVSEMMRVFCYLCEASLEECYCFWMVFNTILDIFQNFSQEPRTEWWVRLLKQHSHYKTQSSQCDKYQYYTSTHQTLTPAGQQASRTQRRPLNRHVWLIPTCQHYVSLQLRILEQLPSYSTPEERRGRRSPIHL